jgi:phospholipid N-methyltransferase
MSDAYAAPRRSQKGLPGLWRPHHSVSRRAWHVASEHFQFLSAFLRNPLAVGAVLPSSAALARAMLADCDLEHARLVVELGPGTGAFTRLILDRVGSQTAFFVMELDANSAARLQARFPGLEVHHESAERLAAHVERHGLKADCVVSGLPWANMSAALQGRVLEAIVGCLSEGGVFTSFAYAHAWRLPGSRRFRDLLLRRFQSVRVSSVVWRNFPPAFVYRCRRPA